MNRRGFFSSLAAIVGGVSISPLIFIPKFEPVRWKIIKPAGVSCAQFTQFLVDMQPQYDEAIIRDMKETDPWLTHIDGGPFDPDTSFQHLRFRASKLFDEYGNLRNKRF
jgi:hypothetical protein